MGSWKSRHDLPLSLTWSVDHLKILGFLVGPRQSLSTENWDNAIAKMHASFCIWKSCDLSMYERAFVAKSFAMSSLWSVAHVVPVLLLVLMRLIPLCGTLSGRITRS